MMVNANELAAHFGLSARTVRDARWRRRAGLPATRIGGRLLFQVVDVDHAIARGRERLGAVSQRRVTESAR
jgi:phage terminase Nu1 subunit (DNA packaging protein)